MAESENSTVLWGIRESSTSVSPSVWPTVDGPLGLHSDEALKYAKGFYYGGFAMLPWLWFVSCFYFWPILVHRQSDTEIRQCESPPSLSPVAILLALQFDHFLLAFGRA